MASFLRRAGTQLIQWLVSTASPSTDATSVQIYAKTVAGIAQLLMKAGDGIEQQLTPSVSVARAMAYWCEDFIASGGVQAVTSTGTTNNNQVLTKHPGISGIAVTTVGSGAGIYASSTGAQTTLIVGGGLVVFEGCALTVLAQDAGQQWSDRFGMGDLASATADQDNGIYFESDRATYGDNDYRLCCAAAGVRTKTTTGTAPAVATFERWRWVMNVGATSVSAFLNDAAIGSAVTAHIPTVGLIPFFRQSVKTLGTSSRTVQSDYYEVYQVLAR